MTNTIIDTQRDASSIEFVAPILGFEHETHFRLTSLEENGLLWALESTQTPDLVFVVAAPEPFFPNYSPEVDESVIAPLGADPAALLLLVILTVSGPLATATANLLAPLVLSPDSRRGMQIVLADDTLPLDAPLRSQIDQ